MFDKLPYNLRGDLSPVSLIGTTPFILAVHPGVAAASVKELIALAKSKPGAFRYGSGGSGSPPHLSFEILKSMTGIDVQHVPYKGVTPAADRSRHRGQDQHTAGTRLPSRRAEREDAGGRQDFGRAARPVTSARRGGRERKHSAEVNG